MSFAEFRPIAEVRPVGVKFRAGVMIWGGTHSITVVLVLGMSAAVDAVENLPLQAKIIFTETLVRRLIDTLYFEDTEVSGAPLFRGDCTGCMATAHVI